MAIYDFIKQVYQEAHSVIGLLCRVIKKVYTNLNKPAVFNYRFV